MLIFKFSVGNICEKLEATTSEIFDLVPFQESGRLGIGHREKSGFGCA